MIIQTPAQSVYKWSLETPQAIAVIIGIEKIEFKAA